MKVGKLQDKLSNISKSKEIKMYHPAAGDWVDFDIIDTKLYKIKKSSLLRLINLQAKQHGNDKVITECRTPKWEIYSEGLLDDFMVPDYEFKTIKMIVNKTKGVSTFDRMGDINY